MIKLTILLFFLLGTINTGAFSPADCLECHGDRDILEEAERPRKGLVISKKGFFQSVHRKNKCIECHKDATDDHEENLKPAVCVNCHKKEVRQYRSSAHFPSRRGKGKQPVCVTCHGMHNMASVSNPNSPAYSKNIPLTCGKCHREGSENAEFRTLASDSVKANFSMSIHGNGFFNKGLKVTATCNDCHQSHDILPRESKKSSIHRTKVNSTCMQCHSDDNKLHKNINLINTAAKSGIGPVCSECHSPHKTIPKKDVFTLNDDYCMSCHQEKLSRKDSGDVRADIPVVNIETFASSVHKGLTCVKCHTDISTEHEPVCINVKKVQCGSCHEEPSLDYVQSAHGKLFKENDADAPVCITCHGAHDVLGTDNRQSTVYRANIPELCGDCHKTGRKAAKRIDGFSDMVEKYGTSIHGRALEESGLLVTAVCTDCHTSHKELPSSDTTSSVHHSNIAGTCSRCHEGIFEKFSQSIHSPEANPEMADSLPACNDCHSSHNIKRVDRTDFRNNTVNQCGKCHEELVKSYFTTYHGKTSYLGDQLTAKCADCHGAHDILPSGDSSSHLSSGNIEETCRKCHQNASKSFTGYLTHANHHDKDKFPLLYYTFWSMTLLLLGTFGFFGIHTLLWFPRSLIERIRERKESKAVPSGKWIRRFPDFHCLLHVLVITSFLSLALTGAALKFSYMTWAGLVSGIFGGASIMGFIHRAGAIITFLYFALHIVDVIKGVHRSKKPFMTFFFNPASIIPGISDVREFTQTVKWFLGLGKKPQYGRWTYWEKFDYFAVFWGVAIIGSTGLMLWFPVFFTRFMPGWVLNIATIIHSDEALLAMGFIFTVHFFNTHFRPEKFPMDLVIFTGRIPLENFIEERPDEYQQAVTENKLEELMDQAPSQRRILAGKIFGFTALFTGFSLVTLIIWSLVSH